MLVRKQHIFPEHDNFTSGLVLCTASFGLNRYACSCFCTVGPGNFCLVHVSLVPVLNVVGEQVSFTTREGLGDWDACIFFRT